MAQTHDHERVEGCTAGSIDDVMFDAVEAFGAACPRHEKLDSRKSAIVHQDGRYTDVFSVEKETHESGHVMIEDPYPAFARMRSQASVLPGGIHQRLTGADDPQYNNGRGHYTVLGFDACSKVMFDNITYSSLNYLEVPVLMEGIGQTILSMIGKEHGRYRSSIQPMMTRGEAAGWWQKSWVEPFVHTLIDQIDAEGPTAELSLQLCARLPMHTVTAAAGLSNEEALALRNDLLVSISMATTADQHRMARERVSAILLPSIAERRREPRDDLISRMIATTLVGADGQPTKLDDEAIASHLRLMVLAGGGTTYHQLGITLFALLSDREQLESVRSDRAFISRAIEESLRWNCTDPVFYRLATKDSVLAGVEVPEGTIMNVCLGAANRDPGRWSDPDVYDLHRPPQRHLGFGYGPHTCLGRFVAEAEMTTAINALLDRLPTLRLDDRYPTPKVIGGLLGRGIDQLHVRFD